MLKGMEEGSLCDSQTLKRFSDSKSSICPVSSALRSRASTHVRTHACMHMHGVLQSGGYILPSLEERRRGRGH